MSQTIPVIKPLDLRRTPSIEIIGHANLPSEESKPLHLRNLGRIGLPE